tara:strand:- start:1088 stop:1360 length:273 start_codon:yes stop_codon:yes gene_type:complete
VNEEELMISKGEAADVLLNTDAFSNTIDQMVQGTFQTFVNSKPEDTEVRERAYSHYRALVDIVSTLRQQVSVKDEIITKNAERNNSEEVE